MSFTGQRDTDLLIMEKLDDYNLFKFCATNKYTRNLCENEIFWRNRLISKFGKESLKFKIPNRTWKNYYLKLVYAIDMGNKKALKDQTNSSVEDKKIKAELYYARDYPDVVQFLFDKYLKNIPNIPVIGGFESIVFLREPLIQFIKNANFGGIAGPDGGAKIQVILEPYLERGILTRSIIFMLFSLYTYANHLSFKENGTTYFKVGPDVQKYLTPYINLLEDRGINPNKFRYNNFQSFGHYGIIPTTELNETQKNVVKDEVLTNQLRAISLFLTSIIKMWDTSNNLF